MPTFETPPGWWVSLANLTQWVHWPALAAGLTFLALINTARIADRANRNDRKRDALIVYAAAKRIDAAVAAFRMFVDECDKGPVHLNSAVITMKLFGMLRQEDLVQGFEKEKLPTIYSYRRYEFAGYTIKQLTNVFSLAERGQMPDIAIISNWVVEAEIAANDLMSHAERRVGQNDWALIHDRTPPYSWAGVIHSLKSLPAKLRTICSGLWRAIRRK